MRRTLHLVARDEYPAYAQLSRQPGVRALRARHADLDLDRVAAGLRSFLRTPRTNDEIRAHLDGSVGEDPWSPIMLARTLLPLVQVPPAGCWRERGRPRFVVDPRKPPAADRAAEHVLRRYLAAFGPASRRDLAAWAGVPQREFAAALQRVGPVVHHDEAGGELLDLPGLELPPASTALPVRLLARWDQALLAHADRRRIIPAELEELRLTLSGDQTVTVDGRVAANWTLRRGRAVAEVAVQPHVELRRRDLPRVRAEARRTARFCEPDAAKVAVSGV
jgi:winged helix DNA-binding protein